MNILGFFKSIFNPKIPTEYYVLKQTQPGIFKVETRFCDTKDPVSVLVYKIDKKFWATTNRRKAISFCEKINKMSNGKTIERI